jgi:hypothetical protein
MTAKTPIVHGTHDGYNNHGCRCTACKAAGSRYQRENGSRNAWSRRRNRRLGLAADWLRRNRPDVWEQIEREAAT